MRYAGSHMKDFVCPKCGLKFSPFGERELTSWSDKIVCPRCSHEVSLVDALSTQREIEANPPGPVPQPAETKIERKQVSDTQLLFYIPATGQWGGLFFFSIFWNAVAWLAAGAFVFGRSCERVLPELFTIMLFPAIGMGLAYAAIRARFAVHLLYLSSDRIRLQRQLFGRSRNYDLATSRVSSVRQVEFYRQNYKPVYGIEIKSAAGKIRFGSMLTDGDKRWLCSEIRGFIEPFAPSLS